MVRGQNTMSFHYGVEANKELKWFQLFICVSRYCRFEQLKIPFSALNEEWDELFDVYFLIEGNYRCCQAYRIGSSCKFILALALGVTGAKPNLVLRTVNETQI